MSEITKQEALELQLTEIIGNFWIVKNEQGRWNKSQARSAIRTALDNSGLRITPEIGGYILNEYMALVGCDDNAEQQWKLKTGLAIAQDILSFLATYYLINEGDLTETISLVDWELLRNSGRK